MYRVPSIFWYLCIYRVFDVVMQLTHISIELFGYYCGGMNSQRASVLNAIRTVQLSPPSMAYNFVSPSDTLNKYLARLPKTSRVCTKFLTCSSRYSRGYYRPLTYIFDCNILVVRTIVVFMKYYVLCRAVGVVYQ